VPIHFFAINCEIGYLFLFCFDLALCVINLKTKKMRKLLLVLAMSTSLLGIAQTETEPTVEKEKEGRAEFYIGLGGMSQSKYNLNEKLSDADLPTLNLTVFEFMVGWNVFEEQYSGDFELGGFGGQNGSGNEKSRVIGFNMRLRPHYNIINKEKIAFTGGLNFAYTTNQVDVFSSNAIIDLNNLEMTKNVLTIKNAMFYVGPSVGVYLFKNRTFATRVNLGYEFALTRGRWKSDFSAVNNTIGESGNNRFVFGITLL
jgi:hypothetical protein